MRELKLGILFTIPRLATSVGRGHTLFHKVKEVYPLEDRRLKVIFADGITKAYDARPLVESRDAFKPLEDDALLDSVEVDVGGYGISWNDDIDLSCDELWEHGRALLDANSVTDGRSSRQNVRR